MKMRKNRSDRGARCAVLRRLWFDLIFPGEFGFLSFQVTDADAVAKLLYWVFLLPDIELCM
jgi:hypothetical protein